MRNVHKIQLSELVEHGIECETINGIREGRLRIVFGGIYKVSYPAETSTHS